ncbi:Uncharacterised protein [Burkholderia pseudomallei]|uniref:hypothetical protein n=1 Tax=Burkholderia pseudomallei TaxID=28450 RepID=UPI000F167BD1|nr:hypothetical protein [Burkholderia pseudomallei]CAJ2908726.1 Uncharacterised protein [Burkholderia pseudomallei]VCF98915.1 Uncharacterised protein [Burkholderia pseudomallei]VCG09019.1 Uncharacterised protein [Burkholderia pseudomallei]VCG12855.1 Uncharacterised protein [Burkholderia pseudomallei]VCG20452.1 Uncharacterised protein [Burkholderia pseudomallei]
MSNKIPVDLRELTDRPPVYRLLGVPEKLRGKHLNHAWKGLAGVPGADEPGTPVVVKYLPNAAQLDIELACGLASQVLKLPVPTPGLVIAEPDDLPGRPTSMKAGRVVLFGSLFQPPDPFMVRHAEAGASGEEHIWESVCYNDTGRAGAAWDELVANPDRHAQNLLFDGVKWWLFDHNLALEPVTKLYKAIAEASSQRHVVTHTARINQLLTQLLQRRPVDHGIEEEAAKFARHAQRLKMLAIEMRRWRLPPEGAVTATINMAALIVELIALRLEPLPLYLAQRLEKPSAETLWND